MRASFFFFFFFFGGRGDEVRQIIPCLRFFFKADIVDTICCLLNRISAQWLSKLRRLLTSVLLRFARELVSLISMPGQHRQLTPTSLIGSRVYCVFTINLPPALLAERPGLLRATAITRGVERTLNKRQHKKLTLEKKICLPLLP